MIHKQHFIVLDGLRAIAGLVVLLAHVAAQHDVNAVPGAATAVDFFFMLSGFVVAYAYEGRLQNGLGLGAFARIRLTRLYPLALLGVSAGLALLAGGAILQGSPNLALVGLAGGFALLLLPSYVFPQWDTAYPLNMASWSLTFELFVNALYAVIVRWLTTPRLIGLIVCSAAVLVGVAVINRGLGVGMDHGNFAYGFERVLFPFFTGVLICRWRPLVRLAPRLGVALLVIFAALLLAPVPYAAVPNLIYVLALFPIVVSMGAGIGVGPRLAAICSFGSRLSYPLYILHSPILRLGAEVLEHLELSRTQAIAFGAAEIAVCIAAALLALKLYDEPVRALLRRRTQGAAQLNPAP